jgi:phenylacetate-CoA ligase
VKALYRSLVKPANLLQRSFVGNGNLYKVLLAGPLSGARWKVGEWRAWENFQRSYDLVPAYRKFIDERGGKPELRCIGDVPDLSVIPETDKATYVKKYTQAERCVGGRIPTHGVVVDESSGSSGKPTSWLRGPEERWTTKQMLQLSYKYALGDKPLFVINAFALGAWATGLSVTHSLTDICIMKSTGPNIKKILDTMEEFGTGHTYVVMGYPPFLKTLADSKEIDWAKYSALAVFGGEAMSEPARRYLMKSFKDVLGSYGASDLEINMSAENAFTVALRQELERNQALREKLIITKHGVLPMVFQYNPLVYNFQSNEKGELVATLSRPTNIAPKIRYNIHDLGHVARFEEVAPVLAEMGLGHLLDTSPPLHLPLLFVYGRSDMSINYYGANVTPDSVREVLSGVEELAQHMEGFQLISREDSMHNKSMEVAVELCPEVSASTFDPASLASRVFDRLAEVNGDFFNAYRNTATPDQYPTLTLHEHSTGPFAGGDGIKKAYVVTEEQYDRL